MKLLCAIYILTVAFAENKEKCWVRCITDLEENELVHLSQKLNALECLQLVQAVYELTPNKLNRKTKKRVPFGENVNPISTTSKECLVNLEQWNDNFPKTMKPSGRAAMEMTLRWLGRPDLAKYVREDHRPIKFLGTKDSDTDEGLEYPRHAVSRRETSPKDKEWIVHGRRKMKGKKKRSHHGNHKSQHKENRKAIDVPAAAHAAAHKDHRMKKKDDKCPHSGGAHTSICWSILFILLFIIACLVAAYFLYKRSRSKARGTRFKYGRNEIKEDKDTFTDCLEWDNDIVCSCSDIEGGCTGKCAMCSGNDQTQHAANYQTGTDDSVEDLNYVRKTRKKKDKKRQRFGFLQKSFQNKKTAKDQENRDRKKTLEKSVLKKRDKMPNISSKDQCACCRCALSSRDNVFSEKKENEKRELHRWKAKKRKEEKRRKKEELRKVERHTNMVKRYDKGKWWLIGYLKAYEKFRREELLEN